MIKQFITVIIPIRNEEKNISRVIDSLLAQDYCKSDFEIIFSDGMSEDKTIEIIKSYKIEVPKITILKNKDKIVSTGFNIALNQARGDIIIRVDGHCEIPNSYLKNCVKNLTNKKADIVGGKINTISSGIIGNAISIAQSSRFGTGNVKFRNKSYNKSDYVDTLAFGAHKRNIFVDIGGYDEEMVQNQDDEFNYRAIQAEKKIWLDSTIQTNYYSRSSFNSLLKQYYFYGFYKVRGLQKRKSIFSIRHIIPAMFILSLIITVLLNPLVKNIYFPLLIILPYLFINMIFSVYNTISLLMIPYISLSYIVMHISYGIGFIIGLFYFYHKWNDTKLSDDCFNIEEFLANKSEYRQ